MVSAIGPGDFVVCVVNDEECAAIRAGTIWCVARIDPVQSGDLPCRHCGDIIAGLVFVNDPVPVGTHKANGNDAAGWCPCGFRPFQGPEQAKRVVSEPVDGRVAV